MISMVGFILMFKLALKLLFLEVVFKVLNDWSKERGEEDDHYIKNVTLPGNELP